MTKRFEIDAETLPDLWGMMLATVEELKCLGGSATICSRELGYDRCVERLLEVRG